MSAPGKWRRIGVPVLRGLLWSTLLVLLAGAGGATWLLTTASGARFGVDQLLSRLPVDAVVSDVGGRLIGPLRLEGIVVSSNTFQVAVRRLELDWEPAGLLRRRATVDRLILEGVEARLNLEALAGDPESVTPAAEPDSTRGEFPLEIDVGHLRVYDLALDVPGIGSLTNGSLEASGGLGAIEATLRSDAEVWTIGGPSARIELRASGWLDEAEVALEADVAADAELPIPPGRFDLVANGSLDSARIYLTADTETGSTPIPPTHIELEVNGGLDGYRLEATVASAGTEKLPAIDVAFSGTGDDEHFVVETADAAVLDGRIRLAGTATWVPKLEWVADVEADSIALTSLMPEPEEWPGRVSFRGDSQGRIVDGRLEATVQVDTLGGHLRGAPLEGRLAAAVSGDTYEIEILRLDWGSLDLAAAGHIGDTVDVAFDLSAPDLSLVFPEWAGAIRTIGSLSGSPESPRIDASYEVDSLRVETYSMAHGAGSVLLDFENPDSSRVDLAARGLAADSLVLDSLSVRVRATESGHELQLAAGGPDGVLDIELEGHLSEEGPMPDRTWSGRVVSLALDIPPAGAWRLQDPTRMLLSADSAWIEPLCMAAEGRTGRVCSSGRWVAADSGVGTATAELTLDGVELSRIDSLLPEGNRVQGGVSGTVTASLAEDGSISGLGTITLGPGTIETVRGGERSRIRFGGPGLQFAAGSQGLSVDLGLEVERDDGSIRTTVYGDYSVPGFTNVNQDLGQQAIEGSLRASMPDLAFLENVLPELQNTRGSATMDLAIRGTVADPRTTGEIVVTGVATDVPDLGLQLRDIEITARSEADGTLLIDGRVTSGAGTIVIKGQSPLVPSDERPTTLSLTGEQFTAVSTGGMLVAISPDLDLRITRDLVDVRGEIVVPSATIEILEVPESAVRVSRDVVIVGDTVEAGPPVRTEADITLTLGEEVFFRGFGLSARLDGFLRIRESPETPTRATGEIQMHNGRYTAFGQNLEIDPGQLVFDGPIDNPGLDVRARRSAQDGTEAGLMVSGTLQVPDIEVYSVPPKSQSEALSYLLFGRPMNETSGSDQGQIGNAAAVVGGSMLATSLGQQVGIDEARIETGANPNEASLVAGKYLSPQLYVAYGIGLYDRASIFRIRYIISRRWTIQVETGRYNGADILYRIERG